MKKSITVLILILLNSGHLRSQVLTYNNFSKCLSLTQHILLADKNTFNMTLVITTGYGVTWDASGIKQQTGTPAINFIYGEPSFTPNGSLYPQSNYAQYDPNLTAVVGYLYYQLTSDSFVSWGDYQPSTQHEIFQNPDKRLVFPFSFGNTFNDTYAKTNYSNATTVSSYQTGSRTVSFAGYGTLILPQGSFKNVALISELRTNSLGPNSTDFTWINLDDGRQLMYYAENNGKVTIFYSTDTPAGIENEERKLSSFIYPNPATDFIYINNHSVFTFYQLTDLYGKLLKEGTINDNKINVSDLSEGNYLLFITGIEGTLSYKIHIR